MPSQRLDVGQQDQVPAQSASSAPRRERPRRALTLFAFLLLPVACSSDPTSAGSQSGGSGPSAGTGSSNGQPLAGAGGNSGVTPGNAGNGGALVDNGLPGRALVRRLSNTEYDATIVSLLGDKTGYAASFPAETVVNGFNNNSDVQDVPPALAEQYMVVSEQIAANATKDTDKLLGCKLSAGEPCISDFISRFGLRAWR
ncbi:MAG TPA: DUF1587 domain-containing protein, partial [Polyangiaceae bacterium]|nr:DUF1587 domain-containing protein [Polyangiaceae bacterium]